MINNDWIELVEQLLFTTEEPSIKQIKAEFLKKYNRNFSSIIIDNILSILIIRHNLNKKITFKILTIRSSH